MDKPVFSEKAQGAIEYLMLVSGALLMVSIIIAILINMGSQGINYAHIAQNDVVGQQGELENIIGEHSGAVCGNSTCEAGENCANCISDCVPVCGDSTCECTETFSTCPSDCAAGDPCAGKWCGDLICSPECSETSVNCLDCGISGCNDGDVQQCDTGLKGICKDGTQTCIASVWGSCIQNEIAKPESCSNAKDDDCDDKTDCCDSDCSLDTACQEICSDGIDQDCSGADLQCPEKTAKIHLVAYFNFQNDVDYIASHYKTIIAEFSQSNAVSQIKSKNPEVKALFYRDIIMMHTSYDDWAEVDSHEDWFVHDALGDRLVNSAYGSYLMDVGSEGWRNHYGDYVKAKMDSSSFDGVFADDTWVVLKKDVWDDSKNPTQAKIDSWSSDMAGMLQSVKSKIGSRLLISNIGSLLIFPTTSDLDSLLNLVDGIMDEGFVHASWDNDNYFLSLASWKKNIDYGIETISKNKILLAQSGTKGIVSEDEKKKIMLYSFCSYLLAEGNDATFSFKDSAGPYNELIYYPEFDVTLGNATNAYHIFPGTTNIYAREFTNGLVLVNPGATSSGEFNLNGNYKTLEGQSITSITMEPHEGVILLK